MKPSRKMWGMGVIVKMHVNNIKKGKYINKNDSERGYFFFFFLSIEIAINALLEITSKF